jgi:SAM-dependent methyltransferase
MVRHFPASQFFGTDTDPDMIHWCRTSLPFADFRVNPPRPPSTLPRHHFDLIYAVSVFTHLDEAAQLAWLEEFPQLLKPAGQLVLTVHGKAVWSALPQDQQQKIRQRGTLFQKSRKLHGIFPDWYQTAFHTESFLKAQCSRHFDQVTYLREGMGYLDLVICQNAHKNR